MKIMKINDYKKIKKNNFINYFYLKTIFLLIHFLILYIILFYIIYILKENKNNKKIINDLKREIIEFNINNLNKANSKKLDIHNHGNENLNFQEKNSEYLNNSTSKIDKDMIGIIYPESMFDKIKTDLINNKTISSLILFIDQLQVKLLYLEKEINVTKLHSFYTARTLYLKKRNIYYDDDNIKDLHNIISWLVIHKSTQLKGIASDKYLVCKYIKIKLGEDLCPHRIFAYNNVEEINFEEILKLGNIVLKISNGSGDKIFILKDKKNDIELIKKRLKNSFERNYGLKNSEFFHSYSKKRIVLEKMFFPLSDLYEFKFYVVNHNIKLIYIRMKRNDKLCLLFYDSNFNLLLEDKNCKLDINKINKNNVLNELKNYAIKLSKIFLILLE